MPKCPASGQSGIEMKKNAGAGTSSGRNKDTQSASGMLLYRTEMSDVGGISLDADAQLCNYVL
jgi:hypothetical protein